MSSPGAKIQVLASWPLLLISLLCSFCSEAKVNSYIVELRSLAGWEPRAPSILQASSFQWDWQRCSCAWTVDLTSGLETGFEGSWEAMECPDRWWVPTFPASEGSSAWPAAASETSAAFRLSHALGDSSRPEDDLPPVTWHSCLPLSAPSDKPHISKHKWKSGAQFHCGDVGRASHTHFPELVL